MSTFKSLKMVETPLQFTIQTYVGMIISDFPRQRPSNQSECERDEIFKYEPGWKLQWLTTGFFSKCALENRMPYFTLNHSTTESKRIRQNLLACCDPKFDISFMKRNVTSLKRLDLEQAASVVISAIFNDKSIGEECKDDLVRSLIDSISPETLINSCMWLLPEDSQEPNSTKFSRFTVFAKSVLCSYINGEDDINVGRAENWSNLLPFLLRVRRCRPENDTRCLFIPSWVFDAAGVNPPLHHKTTFQAYKPGKEPIDKVTINDLIVISRHEFRSLQRRLNAYLQYWKPEIALRTAIKNLSSSILFNFTYMKNKILPSNNTLLVAHAFLTIQRQLQLKIVSDWNGSFLPKGGSDTFLQNTPWIPTDFEKILEQASASGPLSNGIPITGAALPQIDQCCLLMEKYVQIYGNGDRKSLVFSRGHKGGSGRGPVDEYNRPCDILAALNEKALREGKTAVENGPVKKFLAKDIMQCNSGWADDAFAGGEEPGWVGWLEQRRRLGVLSSEGEGEDEEDFEMVYADPGMDLV